MSPRRSEMIVRTEVAAGGLALQDQVRQLRTIPVTIAIIIMALFVCQWTYDNGKRLFQEANGINIEQRLQENAFVSTGKLEKEVHTAEFIEYVGPFWHPEYERLVKEMSMKAHELGSAETTVRDNVAETREGKRAHNNVGPDHALDEAEQYEALRRATEAARKGAERTDNLRRSRREQIERFQTVNRTCSGTAEPLSWSRRS